MKSEAEKILEAAVQAARTLSESTDKEHEKLVDDLINERLKDSPKKPIIKGRVNKK